MISNEYLNSPAPFVLASIMTSYPDEGFSDSVQMVMTEGEVELPAAFKSELDGILGSAESMDDLRSEYIDVFDRGRASNPLYETEYGRERTMFKASELADLGGFYKAFGFELADDSMARDMIDHVAIELEFYALLVMKQHALAEAGDAEGQEIVLDARKKFLDSHLGRFVGAIAERPGVQESRFYSRLIPWCRDLVAGECRLLGVEPKLTSWVAGQAEADEVSCGAGANAGCPK
jgi:nitrate reductase assembly molybdenum cofactor insertion protein NarJ